MKIIKSTGGMLGANSYILTTDGIDCIVIDSCSRIRLKEVLKENKLVCRALLFTHAHFDHCDGAALFQSEGADLYMHAKDAELLSGKGNLAEMFGMKYIPFVPNKTVNDGDEFELCGIRIKVIHTPGHTAGGVCYLADGSALFTGDTLFRLGVGRTDFPSGDAAELKRSVKEKLFAFDKSLVVYPGHGEETDIGFETENNPYV